ncbi:RNA ligase-domain-containing protein [Lipomyces oligophaga]|uniref:RNA ligase-domain-containing protein n=1 Tax=Lipomyces oligophaga TaxID=45792 RepID=UPI0034CFB24F
MSTLEPAEDTVSFYSSSNTIRENLDDARPGKIIELPFALVLVSPEERLRSSDLFRQLETCATQTGPKNAVIHVKHSVFELRQSPLKIHGWKFSEYDYLKGRLPSRARGLFSIVSKDGQGNDCMEIVARGYDKFFNINETVETKWDYVKKNTRAPYYLTQKENGCIIFMSGLPDGNLLVCSKHSTGLRSGSQKSHSEVGEEWINRSLKTRGLTKRDLAATLRNMNCTAVAELCDDAFEEHILEYKSDRAGLYLHGLNLNISEFKTYPFVNVCQFANIFGFRMTKYLEMLSFEEMKNFLDACAVTGSWDGQDVEGFVVRCQARSPDSQALADFFFKYKFEEPYLMYRGWREATRAMLENRKVRLKKHKAITIEYLNFAKLYFQQSPDSASMYENNYGIVKLRKAFLHYYGKEASQIINDERPEDEDEVELCSDARSPLTFRVRIQLKDQDYKYIIVPVATIGCGKTTLSVALHHLLGWGHIQNDNITGKGGKAKIFCTKIAESLKSQPVCIADRNNHLKKERLQIWNDMPDIMPTERIRYIAIHFLHNTQSREEILKTTFNRVQKRGNNHQTIQAATDTQDKVQKIMSGFLTRFQPVDVRFTPDRDMFDLVIDLPINAPLEINLRRIIDLISEKYPCLINRTISDRELDESIRVALDYAPARDQVNSAFRTEKSIKRSAKENPANPKQQNLELPLIKRKKLNYVALAIPDPELFKALVPKLLRKHGADCTFWNFLLENKRVQSEFHVTLMHVSESKIQEDIWEFYVKKVEAGALAEYSFDITGKSIIWDSRVMLVEVHLTAKDTGIPLSPTQKFHITIGTAETLIKPVEAGLLLKDIMNREIQRCVLSPGDLTFKSVHPTSISY